MPTSDPATRQAGGGGTRVDSLVITEAITSSYHGRVARDGMIIPGGDAPFERSIPEPTLQYLPSPDRFHSLDPSNLEQGIRIRLHHNLYLGSISRTR
jgi:hypothetical protein